MPARVGVPRRGRAAPARTPDRAALRRLVRDAGADAWLAVGASSRDPDLMPFTGEARLGECFVLVRADGSAWLGYASPIEREEAAASGLALLVPGAQRGARRAAPVSGGAALARRLLAGLARARVSRRRIALAGRYPNGDLAQAVALLRREGWRFTSGHVAVERLRRSKRGADLAEIREVARSTTRAIRHVASILSATVPASESSSRRRSRARAGGERRAGPALLWRGGPLTVEALRREVAAILAADGLEQPEGNLIAPGREGAVPHNAGLPTSVVRRGESLIVDLFPRRRLHADCTRTFCVGDAPSELIAAHRAVREALARASALAHEGASGFALHEAVSRHFAGLGYATTLADPATTTGYVHGLGHGVGFEVHELPHFRRDRAGADGTLEREDVFTLEPGLYDPEAGYGVRLEDLCRLGSAGLENLTPLPYDLDPRAWPRSDAD